MEGSSKPAEPSPAGPPPEVDGRASGGPAPVGDRPATGESPGRRARQVRQFEALLLSTVTTFVVLGMVPPSDTQQVLATTLLGVTLLLAVRAGGLPRWLFHAVAALAVAAVALSLAHVLWSGIGDGTTRTMNAVLIAVAPPAVAIGVVREIRGSGQVRLSAVMGVLALYMLIGMTFGLVYGAIDRLGGEPFFADGEELTGSNALYFSFTTLTTVGYGDLTARSDVGHTIAAFEALVGQVYLVTVVAAIVGNLRPARPRQG